jgi:predicted transposase YbfD/YdcC
MDDMKSARSSSTGRLEHLKGRDDWARLTSLVQVSATRTVGEETSREWRYYISSLPGDDAEFLGGLIREHWGVENRLHWVLDVSFQEDACRVRQLHGATNLALIRKTALNLLKQNTSRKASINSKRHMAGWDESYLLELLGF